MNSPETIASATPPTTRRLWTSQDLADFLQVSLRWVEKQRALGLLPCLTLPGRRLVRFDPDAIRAWVLQRERDGRGGF